MREKPDVQDVQTEVQCREVKAAAQMSDWLGMRPKLMQQPTDHKHVREMSYFAPFEANIRRIEVKKCQISQNCL